MNDNPIDLEKALERLYRHEQRHETLAERVMHEVGQVAQIPAAARSRRRSLWLAVAAAVTPGPYQG